MTEGGIYPPGVALILGGSGGLGGACAKRIAQEGCDLAISYYRNKENAVKVCEEAATRGLTASCHQLDVSNRRLCQKLIADVITRHKRITTMIYAVGSGIEQPSVAEIMPAQWLQVINHDLHGFMSVVQPVIAHMRQQGGGSLVHVSSAGLGKTPPRDALSVAPKAAIDALVSTIAAEEGAYGIRANSVGVGVIEAGIFKRLEAAGVFDDNWKASVKQSLPMRRFGQAYEIAEAVNFLASARASYITGQTLFVDGGYSC